ncbi:MAG: hypothetical protein JWL79_3609 [Frankiales bacterium]|nr:hypothetical protein [Frankiales bacterium]
MGTRNPASGGEDTGFTLIELLIVIVILGILAAIVVFAVGSARDDSVKSSCQADVKTINTASEAYKAKNGSYPADGAPGLSALQAGSFIKSVPDSTEYTVDYAGGTATGTITGGGTC